MRELRVYGLSKALKASREIPELLRLATEHQQTAAISLHELPERSRLLGRRLAPLVEILQTVQEEVVASSLRLTVFPASLGAVDADILRTEVGVDDKDRT